MLSLAFCQAIAAFFVDIFHGGAGDWDPRRNKAVSVPLSTLPYQHHKDVKHLSDNLLGLRHRYLACYRRFLPARLRSQRAASFPSQPLIGRNSFRSTQCW